MDVETTKQGIKKFTQQEKLSILKEAEQMGVKPTLEKYGLYPATFYYWKKKYEQSGASGLDHITLKEKLKKLKELEQENARLKELLVKEQLENSLKNEILKKKYPHLKKLL